MAYPLIEDASSRQTIPMFPQDDRHSGGTSLLDKKHELNILEKLKQLRDQKKYCDVTLEVRGAKLEAHKNVLASWSPYFAAKLFPDDPKVCRDYLVVNYDNSEVFADLLDFMYNGYVAPRETNFLQLLHLAVSFQIETLKNYCEEFLRCNLHLGNFVSTYFLSRKFSLDSLEEYIVGFLQLNLSDAVKQGEFLSLKAEKFNTFLSKGWMEKIKPEIKLFLIISWVGYDVQEREKFLVLLLGHIDWSTVANDFLLEINRTENFFTSHESSLYLLLQTLFSAGIPLGPYTEVFPVLREAHSAILNEVVHSSLMQIGPEEFHPVTINVKSRICYKDSCVNTVKHGSFCDTRDTAVNTDVNSRHFEENEKNVSTCNVDVAVSNTEENTVGMCTELNEPIDEFGKFLESEIHEINEKQKQKQIKEKIEKQPETTIISEIPQKENFVKEQSTGKRGRKSSKAKKKKTVNKKRNVQPKPEDFKPELKQVNISQEDHGAMFIDDVSENADEEEDSENEIPPVKIDIVSNGRESEEKEMKTRKTRDVILTQIKANKKTRKSKSQSHRKPGKAVECNYEDCAYITKFEKRMAKHIKTAHNSSFELHCNLCPFETKEVRKYHNHMKLHFPGPPYLCDHPRCTYSASKVAVMLTHRASHNDERPFTCGCGMSFKTNNTLIAHKKTHLGKKEYCCPECGVAFATKNTMNQHMVTHSDIRPYLCDLCGFATKFQSHLIAHKRIHSGEVFRCQFPKCDYFTPKRSQLKAHMRAHLGIRAHVCQTCGKSFVERSHLLRHERLHTDKKINCEMCDYTTTRKDKLKEHINKHHSAESTAARTKKSKVINTGKGKKVTSSVQNNVSSSYSDITTPMVVKWDHGGYSMSHDLQEHSQHTESGTILSGDGYCVLRDQLTTNEPISQILSIDQINAQINAAKMDDDSVVEHESGTTTLTTMQQAGSVATAVNPNQTVVMTSSSIPTLGLVSSPGNMDHVVSGTIVTTGIDTDQGSQTYTIIQPPGGITPQQSQECGGLSAFMALF